MEWVTILLFLCPYPFTLIKPSWEEGDVITLKDINQRIRAPPKKAPETLGTSAFSGKPVSQWVITVITVIRAHQSASWPKERPGSGNQGQKSPAEPPPAPLILAFHVYVPDKVSMTVRGAYGALYILNWAYRYFTEQHYG
uniref:Uncharacterized protein n=1 Tax=Oryza rufipogon TaxID=4529 RepID=A0A0E0QR70_ORYRU